MVLVVQSRRRQRAVVAAAELAEQGVPEQHRVALVAFLRQLQTALVAKA